MNKQWKKKKSDTWNEVWGIYIKHEVLPPTHTQTHKHPDTHANSTTKKHSEVLPAERGANEKFICLTTYKQIVLMGKLYYTRK